MTNKQLIDHFAGLAMQAMISSSNVYGAWDSDAFAQVAKFSYAMAVQMMEHKADLIEGGVL